MHNCSLYATLGMRELETFPYTIDYYLTQKGEKPLKEWLDGMKDIAARNKIRIRLDRVRLGSLGDHHHVEKGVYELRVDYGPGYRVYYALKEKTIILLLIGGDKSSQGKDIGLATTYWEDYKRRNKNAKKGKDISGRPHRSA